MSKCILCDKPLPPHNTEEKIHQNLMCDACNQTVDEEGEAETEHLELGNHKEIKKRIKGLKKMSRELKEMILQNPEACGKTEETVESYPKAVQGFMHTPIKSYKMTQFLLAVAKGELIDCITKKDSPERLENALKKAIDKEDYRKSATLQDKINKKKGGK